MAVGEVKYVISQQMRKKLSNYVLQEDSKKPLVGLVVGFQIDDKVYFIDCGTTVEQFPSGLITIGAFCCLHSAPEKRPADYCESFLYQNMENFIGDQVVIFCAYKASDGGDTALAPIEASIYSLSSGNVKNVDINTDYFNPLDGIIFLRARGQLPFMFEATCDEETKEKNVSCAMEKIYTTFYSYAPSFRLKHSSLLLRKTNPEIDDSDLKIKCKDLYNYIEIEENDNFTSKSKAKKNINEKDPLNFDILLQTTGEAALQNSVNHTLVVHYQRREFQNVTVTLPLDVISVVRDSDTVSYAVDLLVQGICQQLTSMSKCLRRFGMEHHHHNVVPFHFWPSYCDFPITVIYPSDLDDNQLESYRRKLHQQLLLPTDKPLLRKANRYDFPDPLLRSSYLKNTHRGLSPSGVQNGSLAIVNGTYTYHHYMQDHVNDDGWGCAYRSLQTIVSWFRFQGYTNKQVPTHKEIQQALVDVGDKPASFVGSKQWIGSQEVSICLNQLIEITSKILFVSSGADLASKGRELLNHFQIQGTPVMIGGGVLAHTILGVDFNEHTGDLKFLILDPHYTGGEDLSVIQNKGWCGWKGPDFWNQTAFYNLCLPQRPIVL